MTRRQRAAERLCTGSVLLCHRLRDRAAAWVARGRRGDLTGWRASLGCWLRLGALLLGLYLVARVVRAMPNLMWLLTTWWVVASWRAGKSAPPQAAADPVQALDVEAVRTLLLTLMEGHSAVHLRTVLAHLQQHPPTAALTGAWTIADLRSRLEALGIPVEDKVKAGGAGPTRGVRRADLAPSLAAAEESSTEPSTAA